MKLYLLKEEFAWRGQDLCSSRVLSTCETEDGNTAVDFGIIVDIIVWVELAEDWDQFQVLVLAVLSLWILTPDHSL
jgi:hypothetical protein